VRRQLALAGAISLRYTAAIVVCFQYYAGQVLWLMIMFLAAPSATRGRHFRFVNRYFLLLALGMIVPVLPKLVISMVGGDSHEAAKIFGIFGFPGADAVFVFADLGARVTASQLGGR